MRNSELLFLLWCIVTARSSDPTFAGFWINGRRYGGVITPNLATGKSLL